MSVYAGLDVSLDAVAICVVDETGEMLWQGKLLGVNPAGPLSVQDFLLASAPAAALITRQLWGRIRTVRFRPTS